MNDRDSQAAVRDSQAAVRELRAALRVGVPVESEENVAARRAKLVASLESSISRVPAESRQQVLWTRALLGLRVAAGFLLVGGFLWAGLGQFGDAGLDEQTRLSQTKPSQTKLIQEKPAQERLEKVGLDKSEHTKSEPTELSSRGPRVLTLPGSTVVEVAASSEMRVVKEAQTDQILRLTQGHVRVSVPEQEPAPEKNAPLASRSVKVFTPHAVVEVKGTIFTVSVDSLTRVNVERGVVLVHHDGATEVLRSGDSWTSSPGGEIAAASPAVSRPDSTEIKEKQNAPTRLPSKASTLSQQNNLLESAITAADRGNEAEAVALIDRLLREHPDSPLRASAVSLKRRLLTKNTP